MFSTALVLLNSNATAVNYVICSFIRTYIMSLFGAVFEKKMLLLSPVKTAAAVVVSAELLIDVTHWCVKDSRPTKIAPLRE